MSPKLEPRVASLETQVERIASVLDRLEQGMNQRDENLMRRIEELGKPRYSFISTVVAIVLTVGGACFALLTKENTHTHALLSAVEERSTTRAEQLDAKLQVEQRLLNDTINTRLSTLNAASMHEHDLLRADILRIQTRLDNLKEREMAR